MPNQLIGFSEKEHPPKQLKWFEGWMDELLLSGWCEWVLNNLSARASKHKKSIKQNQSSKRRMD
jgi:hypothetical protein